MFFSSKTCPLTIFRVTLLSGLVFFGGCISSPESSSSKARWALDDADRVETDIPIEYTAYYPPAAQDAAVPAVTQTRLQTLGGPAPPQPIEYRTTPTYSPQPAANVSASNPRPDPVQWNARPQPTQPTLTPRMNAASSPASAWYDPLGLLTPERPGPMRGVPVSVATSNPAQPAPASMQSPLPPDRQIVWQPNRSTTRPAESRPPITQVGYVVPHEPEKLAATAAASPELSRRWSTGERLPERSSNYRLVSDTQNRRPSPPPVSPEALGTSPRPARTQTAKTSTPARQTSGLTMTDRFPILGIGRDLTSEFRPSTNRRWTQNHAVQQTADFSGRQATVRNIRYSKYETAGNYTTQYYDYTFDLDTIQTLDLIVVPFRGSSRLAHVEASFGFDNGVHLGLSVEARYEEGEQYDPVAATMRQFELIYVFADERDMIRQAADVNQSDVHVYRLRLGPDEVREIFVDALQRANGLARQPEFYHPLTNSCVTNLVAHINKGRPGAIPREYRTLLPGLLDSYAYDLDLIDTTATSFTQAKENAKVNHLVEAFGDLEFFSVGIRQQMY